MIVQYRKDSEPFSSDGVTLSQAPPPPFRVPMHQLPIPCGAVARLQHLLRGAGAGAEWRAREYAWSAPGTGRTNRANHQPIFDDRPHTGDDSERDSPFTVSRRVDENPRSGQVVGRVFADDADNDRLTYELSSGTTDARLRCSTSTRRPGRYGRRRE